MRVAFIDYYSDRSSPHKDPISIPRALVGEGCSVLLVSRLNVGSPELFGLPMTDLGSWLSSGLAPESVDCVIAISRFDAKLTPVLRFIKQSHIPLIVKGDTDGTLGFPLVPNYLRTVPVCSAPLNILRQMKWRFPTSVLVSSRLEHIRLADLTVYESPGAGANICEVLNYWGFSNKVESLINIPNSVSPTYCEGTIRRKKPGKVVALGRWDDWLTKGSDFMASIINDAERLGLKLDFVVIGSGSERIKAMVSPAALRNAEFYPFLDFESAKHQVSDAEIMLAPSRLESFSLACAEALCAGASLVVTPVESLTYLAGGGLYGTVARDFSAASIVAALQHETTQWRVGRRRAHDIAVKWRNDLGERHIGQRWMSAILRIVG